MYVGFVANIVALVSVRVLRFSPVIIIPPVLHNNSLMTDAMSPQQTPQSNQRDFGNRDHEVAIL
jgi:hypothetical protein